MAVSIVEFFPRQSGHSCGYCKSKKSSISDAMWAHQMTVEDYEDLICRGWRRSGCHCYKPNMKKTCCPLYTIRCEALNVTLSKSQKKIVKKVNKFLVHGCKNDKMEEQTNENMEGSDGGGDIPINERISCGEDLAHASSSDVIIEGGRLIQNSVKESDNAGKKTSSTEKEMVDHSSKELRNDSVRSSEIKTSQPDGVMYPLQRKAKEIRREKREKRLLQKGIQPEHVKNKPKNQPKSLEEFLEEAQNLPCKNQLELRLVRSCPRSEEFDRTFDSELRVYQRYQMTVHNDDIDECSKSQFFRFLVDSPLLQDTGANSESFGSFHHQYWVNGELVAVGVIDILHHCVSSVYFFYDPEYSFLSLGTYSSLREIALVRSLNKVYPHLQYYFMGFYIHSCPKMRYKKNMNPSSLLCPEAYTWHPVTSCIPKLDLAKYSRLDENQNKKSKDSDVDVRKVLILWKRQLLPYFLYSSRSENDDQDEVIYYSQLVGELCAPRMALYRR